jgi:hypothetical protein
MSTSTPFLMPNSRSALRNIVQDRLIAATGETVAEFILARRQPGTEVPYRHIAAELVELTGVDITHEAARRWYLQAIGKAAEVVADDVQAPR